MAKVNIQPLGDRVLVKQIEEKEQVKGGIIIPDSAKEKSQEATVVAVGLGRTLETGSALRLTSRSATGFSSPSTAAPK